MKKLFIVVAVVAMAFAACGKKKDAAKPADMPAAGSDMGSAAGSDMGSAAGSDAAPAPTP